MNFIIDVGNKVVREDMRGSFNVGTPCRGKLTNSGPNVAGMLGTEDTVLDLAKRMPNRGIVGQNASTDGASDGQRLRLALSVGMAIGGQAHALSL